MVPMPSEKYDITFCNIREIHRTSQNNTTNLQFLNLQRFKSAQILNILKQTTLLMSTQYSLAIQPRTSTTSLLYV